MRRLAQLLSRGGPPSLIDLAQWMDQGEETREFLTLVREFLPEHEEAILREAGVTLRIAAFARFFEQRHFPLPDQFRDGWVDEYEYLVYQVPIIRLGIDYDDYHDLPGSWRLGYQLLFALTADPFEGWSSEGARIPLLDECASSVPRKLLERTGKGFPTDVLEPALKGTKYEGALIAARWLHNNTDNAFLDITGEQDANAPWEEETLEYAGREWREAVELQDKMDKMVEWLEEDPPARFEELLAFIEARTAGMQAEKKPKTLAEVFAQQEEGGPPAERR